MLPEQVEVVLRRYLRFVVKGIARRDSRCGLDCSIVVLLRLKRGTVGFVGQLEVVEMSSDNVARAGLSCDISFVDSSYLVDVL